MCHPFRDCIGSGILKDDGRADPQIINLDILHQDIISRAEFAADRPVLIDSSGSLRTDGQFGLLHAPNLSVIIVLMHTAIDIAVILVTASLGILDRRNIIATIRHKGTSHF